MIKLGYDINSCNILANFPSTCQFIFGPYELGGVLQVLACYLQLIIIVGLCLDSGRSWTSRIFKTKIMQFIGRISMSLYLIHGILIKVMKWAIWKWTGNFQDLLQFWALKYYYILSFCVATVITLFIEEPTRKFLNQMITKRKETNQLPREKIVCIEEGKPLLEYSSVSCNKVWVKKRAHVQKFAISKKSTFFGLFSWNLVKLMNS